MAVMDMISKHFDDAILKQRADLRELDKTLQASLQSHGLVFNTPDTAPFKAALAAAGFYKEWKEKLGAESWSQLEKYAGTLG